MAADALNKKPFTLADGQLGRRKGSVERGISMDSSIPADQRREALRRH